MFTLLRKFRRNQSGATAIEYALIAALISTAAIAAYSTLATSISNKMTSIAGKLDSANP